MFVFTVIISINTYSQYSDTYYIGTGQDFETIQGAINALASDGIDGAVTMLIKSGSYNEQISIPAIPGASAANTITFRSETLNPNDVMIYFAPTTSGANWVIQLNGCSYITLEYLKIVNTTTGSYAKVIAFNGTTEHNSIKNNTLIGKSGNQTSSDQAIFYHYRQKINSTEISNNTFLGGSYAIYFDIYSYPGELSNAIKINSNTFSTHRGLFIEAIDKVEIIGNTISTNNGNSLYLNRCNQDIKVLNNKITSYATTAHNGMLLELCEASIAFRGIIANNAIYVYDDGSNTSNLGIELINCTYQDIYHNTVFVKNTSSSGYACLINQGNNMKIKNNLFAVENNGYAFGNNTTLTECNNNNYFTPGNHIAKWNNENIYTLADLKTASGANANSTDYLPSFVSTANVDGLIPQTHWLDNTGANLLSMVPEDIEGVARTETPDVGAYEFTVADNSTYSGNLTIKASGGDFTSFNEAIDALKLQGISGSINVLVDPGTYSERVVIPAIPGVTSDNTITITSATGDSTTVTLQYASTSESNNSTLIFDGADYITVKKMTLRNTGSTYGRVITLIGHASNITIENCVLVGSGSAAETTNRSIIYADKQKPQWLLVKNNSFSNGSNSITLIGITSDRSDKATITGNVISGGYASIKLSYYTDFEISGNQINSFTNIGFYLYYCASPYSVNANKLSSTVTPGRGMLLERCSGTNEGGLIFNNFVHVENSSAVYGIYMYITTSNTSIYNNSINVVSSNTGSRALYYYFSTSAENIIFKNNNYVVTGPGLPFHGTSSIGITESDYNNFFTSGTNIANWGGTSYTTLASLTAASGMDTHSVNFDPNYLSDSDLHTNSYWLDNKGTPIPGIVTHDIDGEERHATTPDIGADEYTSTLIPLEGEYTIGPTGDFETFNIAINTLVQRGVLGDVVLKVQNGIYYEQMVIPQIAGASLDATITFESETGNAQDVTIAFDPGLSNNYIVKFEGGDYLTFQKMTFQSGSNLYSRIFVFEGKCEHNGIIDNILYGRSESTLDNKDAVIFAMDNNPLIHSATITDNYFIYGSYGIFFENINSTYGENLVVSNNVLNTFQQGIYIKYFSAPKIEDNNITFIRADGVGINAQYCYSATSACMIIRNNRIYADNYTNISTSGGIYLNQCNANESFRGLIANNIVRLGIDNSSKSYGINISNSSYLNFYFNTVNITSNHLDDIAFYATNSNYLNISNNNFVLKGNLGDKSSSLGWAYYINNCTVNVSNYNNYYSARRNFAHWNGINCETLQDLRNANGKDANSVSYFPAFRGGNNVYSSSSWIDNKGTHIASVTTDINGNLRSETTPDIGAYEFTSTLTPIPQGTFTVGFGGDYPDADSLANALMELGIAGPVTFNFLAGSHLNTNFALKDIPGANANDTVIVQSQSGNPANTIISCVQTETNNYIVKLNGTDFITFQNLTFNAGGTTYSSLFRIDGNAKNINIFNNAFNGATTSSDDPTNKSSIYIADNQIVDNLLVKNNTLNNNSCGIYFGGYASYNHSNIIIQENTFDGQYRQIYFLRTNKPYILNNTLNNGKRYGIYLHYSPNDSRIIGNKVFSSNTNFYGIYIYYCDGTTANRGLIANNFVSANSSASYNSHAIKVDNSNYQKIYHNSTMITGAGAGSAFDVYLGGNIQSANNIFTNYGTDTYTFKSQNNTAITVSNYNDFYSTSSRNIRYNSVDYATLAAYQATSFLDNNSLAVDPVFTSTTDFHLLGASPVIGIALPLTDVTTDIDSEDRDPSSPDMGADEFSCLFFMPPIVQDASGCSNEACPSLYAEGTNIKWYSDPELTNEIWSANTFNPGITVAGVYTYYVTQAEGECTSVAAEVTLTIHAAPILSAEITHIDCQGTDFGSINLTVSGSTGPFSYIWSNDEITQDITGLAAGDYTVWVSDINGCSETETYTVTSPSEINLLIITEDTECNTNMGSATVVASGGEVPYTYYWTTGETGTVIDSLYSGIYFVTVTDALECSQIGVATINDIGGPSITVESVTNVSCYGGSNGAISLSVSGGASPYEYIWSNGAITEDINNIQADQYEIQVTDSEGCKAVESIVVSEPSPIIISLNITQTTCGMNNGAAQVVATGGTPSYSYLWSTGSTASQISGLGLGVYNVVVSDANACSAIKYFSISEIGAPTVIIDSIYNGTCGNSDGAIYISVYGAYETYTYLWSNGAETEDLIGVDPGTYHVTVSDEGGCDAIQIATIPADKPEPNPICLVTVDSDTYCNEIVWEKEYTAGVSHYNIYKEGSQSGVYNLIGSVGMDEESVFVDTLSNVMQRSWRYKISVVDSCGVESILSEHHKTMHLTMNLGLNNSVNLIWDHYEGFLYSTYYIYRRSNADWELIATVPSNLTSYTDFDPVLDETLYYVIEIQHPYGCDPTKTNRNISRSNVTKGTEIETVPPPGVQDVTACTNEEIPDLYAEGENITWYDDIDLLNQVGTGNTYSHGLTEPGVYTFYVTQTINGLPGPAAQVTLTIWAAPELSAIITNIDCQYNEFGSIDLTVTGSDGPFNYLWSNDEISQDINYLPAGNYTVIVSDINGCSEIGEYEVQSPSEIVLTITSQDSECNASTGSANVSASNGVPPYTYEWTNGGSGTSISNLSSGIYFVTVEDSQGCSQLGVATISDVGGPTITVQSVTDVSCFGGSNGSINISVSGGSTPYIYEWSNGAITEDTNNLPAGLYEIEVTDAIGCKATESIFVYQPDPIGLTLEKDNSSCGMSNGAAQVSVTGGTSPYSYSWSAGGNNPQISNLSAGAYSITVTDANTCSKTKYFTISETSAPVVIVDNVIPGNCGNSDGAAYITVYGSGESYTYLWSNGNESEDLVGVDPDLYHVAVSDELECTAFQIIPIHAVKPEINPLCLIYVDSTLNKNVVVWEKQYTENVDSYNIYKEGSQAGVYNLAGSVDVSEQSIFVDDVSNALQRPWRYRISVVDECGVESMLSESHKTMHLSINLEEDNDIVLHWNHYKGFDFDSYYIHRRSNLGWEQIGSVSSSTLSFTDDNPILDEFLFYVIEVQHSSGCNPAKTGVNSSFSNVSKGVKIVSGVLIFDSHILSIHLYPNPNDGSFIVRIETSKQQEFWYSIYSISGQLIEKGPIGTLSGKSERKIIIPNISNGTYFFKVHGNYGTAVKKIVINK